MLVRSPFRCARVLAALNVAALVILGMPRSLPPAKADVAIGSMYCGEAGGPTKKYLLTNGLPGSSQATFDGLGFTLTVPLAQTNGQLTPVLYGQVSNLLQGHSDQINAYLTGQTTPVRTINLPAISPPSEVFVASGGLAVGTTGLLYVGVQFTSLDARSRRPVRGRHAMPAHVSPPARTPSGSLGFASVAIYTQTANGNATPIQVLSLPGEYINGIALDASGTLYALDGGGEPGLDPAIYVFTSPLTNPTWQRKLTIGKYGFYFGLGLAYYGGQLYTTTFETGASEGTFINVFNASGSGKVNPVRQITSSVDPYGWLSVDANYIYQGYENDHKCDVFANGSGNESPLATVSLPRTEGNTGTAIGP